MSEAVDFLVVGGGVIGLSIARELKRRHRGARTVLLEKERDVGLHASGRNSGVLHAGFYYSADSLKARLTRVGNERLLGYCQARGLRVRRCGKLVVARSEAEHAGLDELLRRARANGVPLENVDEQATREIEPRARTVGRALYSPSTAVVDPGEVMGAMKADALAEGVELRTDEPYVARDADEVRTTRSRYAAGYVVNAAGLYADRVARDFGFSRRYRVLPFKGIYLYSDEPPDSLRTHVYPVPDMRNPFLGVHFTVTVDGLTKIGPTAMPALWREQYGRFENFRMGEFVEIAQRGLGLLFASDFDFRRLAFEELRKYSRHRLVALAGELLSGVEPGRYRRWGKAGIRAQLVDLETRRLEMDFVLEGDARSAHVLNAVSPAFTCALSFADTVCDWIAKETH